MSQVNIDSLVDYRKAYGAIEGAKITGDSLVGRCPFHDDRNASLSVNLKNGLYKCFACGAEGNYLSYRAQADGIDTKEAYLRILSEHGLSDRGAAKVSKKTSFITDAPYSVGQYATEKHLPEGWLQDMWRLSEGHDKAVGQFVRIPYFTENQEQAVFRKRYPKGASQRFAWGSGSKGKLCLYGLWLMEQIRDKGYVVLVEGESDTQTLWYLDIPALGVPGATTFRPEWAQQLSGLRVYLHIEPDNGGETFKKNMFSKLYAGEFLGQVLTFSCGPTGCKDPSELLVEKGHQEASRLLQGLLEAATPVDLAKENEVAAIPGAPVNFRQPEGWIVSEQGIAMIDEKTMQPKNICRTPLLLTKRMRNETGEEKIEIAYRRDGRWTTTVMPRTTVFQARAITQLAQLGCTITSENARQVVSFLGAMEAENLDSLELRNSTSHCGWQLNNQFFPGAAKDLEFDGTPEQQQLVSAYCCTGTKQAWLDYIKPHRARPIFRAYIAAALAAPMLYLCNARNFIFYNWATSGRGKTAALKAALSCWGDPNRLMISFNATSVALERRAAFSCDLPFGIDERQSASRQDFLENLVYMLGNGVGRARGAKEGNGTQAVMTWRTIAIMTGEEPLMQEYTKGGVSNRTLEIYGAPFDSEEEAAQMHQVCDDNCGWVGPAFVNKLLEHKDSLSADYQRWLQLVLTAAGTSKRAHAASIALLAFADECASKWLWELDPKTAEAEAKHMALQILEAVTASDPDSETDRALQFVQGWVTTNWRCFQKAENQPVYGWVVDGEVFVLPNVLRAAMEEAKFSYRKCMKEFSLKSIIRKRNDGKFTVPQRHPVTRLLAPVHAFDKRRLFMERYENFEPVESDEPLPF